MENEVVKHLRIKYGIGDSRNEYTKEEIMNIIKIKAHVIAYRVSDESGEIDFYTKELPAYISKDNCVWAKDSDIDTRHYLPMVSSRYGKEIEPGIIRHNDSQCYNVFYCFDHDLDYCLQLVKREIADRINNAIKEHAEIIAKLQNELDTYSEAKESSLLDYDEPEREDQYD